MEIALADNPDLALYAPGDLIERGREVVQRVLPQARSLISQVSRLSGSDVQRWCRVVDFLRFGGAAGNRQVLGGDVRPAEG